jgi:hypothetical protein
MEARIIEGWQWCPHSAPIGRTGYGSFGSAWSLESISRLRGGKTFEVSPETGESISSKPSFTFFEKGRAAAWTWGQAFSAASSTAWGGPN